MNERAFDIETMLRQALAPVEPPVELQVRLESTLGSLVEMAADELETQRQRHRRRAQSGNLAELAFRTVRDGGREARRLLEDLR